MTSGTFAKKMKVEVQMKKNKTSREGFTILSWSKFMKINRIQS
jgi:hypothetical protein